MNEKVKSGIRLVCRSLLSPLFRDYHLSKTYNPNYLGKKWIDNDPNLISATHLENLSKFDLSLIIPLFNSEKYIDRCLHPLLHQETSYKYEIVLVDDGSKDQTLVVARNYQERFPDIIKLIEQTNQGISAARNAGLQVAAGKYLGFIDHDDTVAVDYVQKLMDAAFFHKADIVKCGYASIEGDRRGAESQTERAVIHGPLKENLFHYASYIWAGCYKRRLFEKVRFPLGYWYEDMITRALLYQQSQCFVNIGDVLYFKYSHTSNASKVVWSKRSYKCLEQLYLVRHIAEAAHQLSLNEDVYFYRTLLLECKRIMVTRTRGIDIETREQMFLSMREFLKMNYRESYKQQLPEEDRLWNDVIFQKNFIQWLIKGI